VAVGQETRCVLRWGDAVAEGCVRLESEHIRFRGEFRLTIPLAGVRSVEALDGVLRVCFPDGVADFEVGPLAVCWAEKIRHPPTLIDKLDVKPTSRVAVLGVSDAAFWTELRARTEFVLRDDLARGLDFIVLGVEEREHLEQLPALEEYLRRDGAIWIIAPKGQPRLTEMDVLAAGRAAGLTDVKVARFSATHTAHKFVIPKACR
jgi:hypothetical protein